jgi:hypothetical protein
MSGGTWRRVTTPHFVLRTDFEEATAVEAAKKLEATRDALISAEWPTFPFPEVARTEVYVLSNSLEFERLFGRRTTGLYMGGRRAAFVLYGPPHRWEKRTSLQAESTSVLRHELAHRLAALVFSHEPRWFAEGLAQFLETVHESEDHKSVIVGAVNMEAFDKYKAFRGTTVRTTLGWTEGVSGLSDADVHGLYGMSWLFVHWLYNTRSEPFARYQNELVRGTDPDRAWDIAFPGFDPDAMDTELQNYFRRGNYEEFSLPLRSSTFETRADALSPADAHVARARVLTAAAAFAKPSERDGHEKAANAELTKALQLDPHNVDGIDLAEGVSVTERLALVRRAAAARPDDPRVFRLLGSLLTKPADRAEREQAYRQALKLDPNDPRILNELAWMLVEQRKASEALPLALRAFKRAPHDAAIIDTYAVALFQMGRCQTAIDHEQRALSLQSESSDTSRLTSDLKRHLKEFRTGCSEAKAAR